MVSICLDVLEQIIGKEKFRSGMQILLMELRNKARKDSIKILEAVVRLRLT